MSLFFYYGTECPHCEKMMPLIDQLETENGVKVERVEVWHNDENMHLLEEIPEQKECGGVPFLFNEESRKWICGEAEYEEIKKWAVGSE